ncbi:MAG: hypothetical protein JXA10_17830 [Anaerolineae bacterium]|nr:hypothetical protein [Anaerolineae bacterium]
MLKLLNLLLISLPLGLALLVYGYTLRLPLFLDDGPNFWLVETINGIEQWEGSSAFPYYRPVAFSIWKLSQAIMGGHHAAFLHLLNVLVFGATGVITGVIARRLVAVEGQRHLTAESAKNAEQNKDVGAGLQTGPPSDLPHVWGRKQRRGFSGTLVGLIAGCFVILVPFSYQAVTLISGLFHLTLALGFVLCIWFALRWLDGDPGDTAGASWINLILCWISAFLGVFSHENGPMLAPLLVLLLIPAYWRGSLGATWQLLRAKVRRILWAVIPVSVICGAYTLLWFRVPRFETGEGLVISAAPADALAHLMQGLVYPLIAVWRYMIESGADANTVSSGAMLAVTAGIVGAVLIGLFLRARAAFWVALYGVIWYMLGVLSSVLFLGSEYVLGSPRLMLLGTVGAGLFWASALWAIIQAPPLNPLPTSWRGNLTAHLDSPSPCVERGVGGEVRRGLIRLTGLLMSVVFLIASLTISVIFLRARQDEFVRVGAYTDRLMALADALPIEDSGLLLFNAPNYIAPEDPMFLMGAEGAAVMLDIINYEQQIWLNTGKDYPLVRPYTVAATRRHTGEVYSSTANQIEGGKLYNRFRQNPGWYVIATQFADGEFWPVYVGHIEPGADDPAFVPPAEDDPIAVFPEIDHALVEAGAVYAPERAVVTVRTRWRSNDLPAREKPAVKLFVHVWCDGELIGQSDGYPWLDMYPFAVWRPAEVQSDTRDIVLKRSVDPACLAIYTGLYWETTVDRLAANEATTGEAFVDGYVPVPLLPGEAVTDDLLPFGE